MRLPKVIQTVFHDPDGKTVAHDYYLNASWITEICDRVGSRSVGELIARAIEAKRKRCVERYGEEWGGRAIAAALKRQRRKPRQGKTDKHPA